MRTMTPLRNRQRNRWIAFAKPRPRARLRLFCFPFAGGGATAYRQWSDQLPETIEVMPVELPGRASRFQEKPFRRLDPLLDGLVEGLTPELDRPFAFFGHSMGALIGFELARRLRKGGLPSPQWLFVSARRAPQLPPTDDDIYYDLPEAEFIAKLRELNGTPEEVLAHPELMQMMLPLLRADFELNETLSYREEAALDCPISAFGGLADVEVPREDLESWGVHSNSGFKLRMLEGDHFFLGQAGIGLFRALHEDLATIL